MQGINCQTFSPNPPTRGKHQHHLFIVVMVTFSSRARISGEGVTIYSLLVLVLLLF